MEVTRRGFMAALAATAIVPLPKEAPTVNRVDVKRNGAWTTEPNGLRSVRSGERVRMLTSDDNLLIVEFTACEDGELGTDSKGRRCGIVQYTEADAVYGPGHRYGGSEVA